MQLKKVNGVVEEIDVERMDDNGVYEIEVETNVGEEEIYINKKNRDIIAEKEFELTKMKMMMNKMKTIWIADDPDD